VTAIPILVALLAIAPVQGDTTPPADNAVRPSVALPVLPVTLPDGKVLLSGNFAELRNNHFHSGVDFKTGGREGLPVCAAKAGFVARISVSHTGYGNALYVSHPDGTTTVYAHLQRFAPHIADTVRRRQYEEERFAVDFAVPEGALPVTAGEVIAWSGNTGSSSGPHLHFELRDSETEEVMDPLEWYRPFVRDSRPPQVRVVYLRAVEGRGVVGDRRMMRMFYEAGTVVEAWGHIGAAVAANDFMDGVSHVYGVKRISLAVDGVEVFCSDASRFAFSESRFINSFIDYAQWQRHRRFFMKSFIDPDNALRFVHAERRGLVCINEERDYRFVYTLSDAFGNTSHFRFTVRGRRRPIPPIPACDAFFRYDVDNRFGSRGIRLFLPAGALYDDISFRYAPPTEAVPTHLLHDEPVSLHRPGQLTLFLSPADTLPPAAYGVVRRLADGGYRWIGGRCDGRCVTADIRELGAYALAADTMSPQIRLLACRTGSNPLVAFAVRDDMSGLNTYRAELDGRFVLFERLSEFRLVCRERLPAGELTLTVMDGCSNVARFTHRIK
jgi:hypothetical protein